MKLLKYFKSQKEDSNFDLLPDGIFTLEQDGKIIDVNDKVLKLYRTNRFGILGRYFSDFIENGTSILNKITQQNTSATVKAKIEFDDEAHETFFDITASRNPETLKVYVCVRNITVKQKEQKTISDKYVVAQKIIDGKNDFLLDSSGAILSNLVSISGFSRALLDGIGGALSEKQEKYLNIINTNAKDLSYDLEKLFALFKVESNRIEYKHKLFDLISLIVSKSSLPPVRIISLPLFASSSISSAHASGVIVLIMPCSKLLRLTPGCMRIVFGFLLFGVMLNCGKRQHVLITFD